jgi:zinc transporter, ZIP family
VLVAALWGLVAGSSLLVGAAAALWRPWSKRAVGMVMAFGSGVLISSVSFDLVEEALDRGGRGATTIGLAAGALSFYVGDVAVSRRGGRRRKSAEPSDSSESNAAAVVVGSVLDGIPESAAIGISLLDGGHIGVAFVAAVFLSNIPEGLSASAGLARAGRSRPRIFGLWALVVAVSTLAAAAGYGLLDGAADGTVAALSAYAGGAVLTMLASTMLPEAHEDGGATSGLVTTAGFLAAVLLDSFV